MFPSFLFLTLSILSILSIRASDITIKTSECLSDDSSEEMSLDDDYERADLFEKELNDVARSWKKDSKFGGKRNYSRTRFRPVGKTASGNRAIPKTTRSAMNDNQTKAPKKYKKYKKLLKMLEIDQSDEFQDFPQDIPESHEALNHNQNLRFAGRV